MGFESPSPAEGGQGNKPPVDTKMVVAFSDAAQKEEAEVPNEIQDVIDAGKVEADKVLEKHGKMRPKRPKPRVVDNPGKKKTAPESSGNFDDFEDQSLVEKIPSRRKRGPQQDRNKNKRRGDRVRESDTSPKEGSSDSIDRLASEIESKFNPPKPKSAGNIGKESGSPKTERNNTKIERDRKSVV